MKVFICATSFGHIIGELVGKTANNIILKNPGQIQSVQTQQGVQFGIGQVVPHFLKNKDELTRQFPILKANILFSGEADAQVSANYEAYVKELVKQRSGIHVVGNGVLDKLKSRTADQFNKLNKRH